MFIERDGVRLHYVQEGSGPHTVVLLHGVGSNLASWDGVVPALRDEFTIVRPDLRGHGESDKPPGPYVLLDFVEDLRALLLALDVRRVDLVGSSFGGMIAQAFALTCPELLERLVVISAVAGRTPEQRAQLIARADALQNGGATRTVGAALDRWYTPEYRAAHPELIEQAAARVLDNDPTGYAAAYRVFAENDLADELHRISAPSLIVTGEHDPGSSAAMAYLMHERIPGSHVCVLPRYRHALLAEAPDLVARLIRDYLVQR
jgi:pimeloyl-ACP methyl ester carboxylesterase